MVDGLVLLPGPAGGIDRGVHNDLVPKGFVPDRHRVAAGPARQHIGQSTAGMFMVRVI